MEVNAWVQRSASNSIRYRARQNPSFWPKKDGVSCPWMRKRQCYGGYFAISIEAAAGIGIAFVFFFRGDGKLSQPQMLNLEVPQFVRIGGRDLGGHSSVHGPGGDRCTFSGPSVFVDDSPFDYTWTFIRRNNSHGRLSSARTQNCCHKQWDRPYPAVHSPILPQLHLESVVCAAKRALLLNSRPDGGTGRHENATTWAACGRDRRLPDGRTYPQALDWIFETGYLLRQTVSPVALAGEECFHFFRNLVHRLVIRLARQANLLYADGFSIDPYRCWK
jgi:hypothetical protein